MEMKTEEISAANETLRVQIADLRETVASLDVENQELLKENRSLKDKNKTLQEAADGFRSTMEEKQKMEDVREKIDDTSGQIHQLELQNKSLVKANQELNKELHEVYYQTALLKDFKVAQERDFTVMKNLAVNVKKYLRCLEDKLEEIEKQYAAEKSRSAQLKEKVEELLQNRESQRKGIRDLQGQVELSVQQAMVFRVDQENNVQMGSLMHEIMEARLVDVVLNRSRKRKVIYWLLKLGKFLTVLVFGCGLLLGLALLYTYFINQQFISDTILVLVSDQNIEKIVQALSQLAEW
uniref:Uncharacterized protein n=1 Tax=Sphaerodactylus townsendi TaxID=933632 RepID=A0ACB8FFP0_9SAUR